MIWLLLTLNLASATTHRLESFEVPHWVELLPAKINDQVKDLQTKTKDQADDQCRKEREDAWAKHEQASALAEGGAPSEKYVEAADAAEAASAAEKACRSKSSALQILSFSLVLKAEPAETAAEVGKLVIEVHPWNYDKDDDDDAERVRMFFVEPDGKRQIFIPDVTEPFADRLSAYHTVSGKSGPWLRLPAKPFPKPVWVNMAGYNEQAPLSILKLERPVFVNTGDSGTYVIFTSHKGSKLQGYESTELRTRKGGPRKPVSLGLNELFDKDGHLRARWQPED